MRRYTYRFVIILWLPLQVLCLGLKLEGLIDLGPKWDYAYKLTPINSNENDKATNKNNLNIIRTNKKVEDHDLDFVAESVETNKQDTHKIKETASQENIGNDSVSDENDKYEDVSADESSSESYSEDTTPRKFTKQDISSRGTYLSDDAGNADIEVTNKIDKLTTTDGILDKRNDVSKQTLGNVSDSLLRMKMKRNEQKIKDNAKIIEFTVHIFNQSLEIFDKMRKSTDDEKIKRKLSSLKQSFIEKFSDFLKDISEYKLKTKLANQNVILHTIDVNNYILKRIVNSLSDDKDGSPVRISGIVNIFKNEVEKVRNIENKHACMKLSICRSDEEYSDFIKKILDIILVTDNRKIKQVSDALTETVKTNDFSNILDAEAINRLNKLMTNVETWDPFVTRSMFLMFRSVLAYKNLPIMIMARNSELDAINKTITVHSLIHILNKNMGTVENKNEWTDILKRMEEWRDGKRNDVQKTIELIVRQIIKVLEKADIEIRNAVNDLMNNLLSRR